MIRITSDKKKEIINNYNSTSHFYDKRYSEIQYEKFDLIVKENNVKEKRIFDAGAGTGLLLQYIHERLNLRNFTYIATDISWKMLMILKDRIKTLYRGGKNNVGIVLSDLENLPFRETSFNSLFALTSLQNLPNIIIGVKELFNVALRGADFNFSVLKKKLDKEKLLLVLEESSKQLATIEQDSLEDIIFQGILEEV